MQLRFLNLKAKVDLSLIEHRTLLLAIIFSLMWGFKSQLRPFFVMILHDCGYSAAEIGLASFFFDGVWCIFIVLLFAVFFYACSQNFVAKVGSTIISAVVGNVIGLWAGDLAARICLMHTIPSLESSQFFLVSNSLSWGVGQLLFYEFAAIASAFLVREWNKKLEQAGFKAEDMKRPGAVLVAFIIYIILGVTSLILAFIFLAFSHLISELVAKLKIFIVSALLINGVAGLIVGNGIYNGKRWGWLFAFLSSAAGVFTSISSLIAYLTGGFAELLMLIAPLIALLLDLIILACLLPATTREYFRFINPEIDQNQ